MRKKIIEKRTWTVEAIVEKSETIRVRRRRPVTPSRCDHCGHESRSATDPPENLLLPIRVSKLDK